METTPNDLKESATSAGNYATEKARQLANAVSEKIQQQELKAEELYRTARVSAEDALDTSADFVKKHPFSTVAGAAALGFIAGILLRRTKH
ncbi:MAG TPA: hypothetical protein VIG33_17680 [Pseudobdellovibrionaceae bacterium]